RFTWIGNITNNVSLCATWHTNAVKTWDDVLTKPLTLGGEGPGADLDNFAVLLRTMFGAKIKLVTGYPGGTEVNLAVERGEVGGRSLPRLAFPTTARRRCARPSTPP